MYNKNNLKGFENYELYEIILKQQKYIKKLKKELSKKGIKNND